MGMSTPSISVVLIPGYLGVGPRCHRGISWRAEPQGREREEAAQQRQAPASAARVTACGRVEMSLSVVGLVSTGPSYVSVYNAWGLAA